MKANSALFNRKRLLNSKRAPEYITILGVDGTKQIVQLPR